MTNEATIAQGEDLQTTKSETIHWLRQGLTLEEYDYRELSEILKVSKTTIIRWFKGNQFPRPDKFKMLALLLTEDIAQEKPFKQASLGGKLFLLRNFEGLTIDEMSNGAMVNVNLLRKWEGGTDLPDHNQTRRLMHYFDVSGECLGIEIKKHTLGSYLQEERMALAITQHELGQMLNKSAPIISNYENDKRLPTQEDLIRLSEIFNVSIESFLLDSDGLPYEKFAHLYVDMIREGKIVN